MLITLQACMNEVMKRQGGIDYHIPHMNKTKAAREGTLHDYLSVDKQLVVDSLQHLFTKISSETMKLLVEMIGYAEVIEEGQVNVTDNITTTASQMNEQQIQQQEGATTARRTIDKKFFWEQQR